MNINFAHANGFSYQTYRYFISLLAPLNVTGIDKLGHGTYPHTRNWFPLVNELISYAEHHGKSPQIGVGHSLGGVLTFWAARQRPDLFEKVILLDPPMFSPKKRVPLWFASQLGMSGKVVPPAKKTRNRRTHFASKEEAHAYFAKKTLFKNFHPESLKDYIKYGLKPNDDAFELDFDAKIEYQLFCQTPTRLGKQAPSVPTYFIYSTAYQVLQHSDVAWLKRRYRSVEFIPFEAGHMFPLEHPQKAAKLIKDLIAR